MELKTQIQLRLQALSLGNLCDKALRCSEFPSGFEADSGRPWTD